jgi:hypothetical protein
MRRRTFVQSLPALGVLAGTGVGLARDLPPLELPKPEKEGGSSVLAALWARKTTREIRPEALPVQTLSNLLWAAFGVNRLQGPSGSVGRTAASAFNSQEIDVYVALSEAVYLYEAVPHRLMPVTAGDLRDKVGGAPPKGARQAPVKLIYVVDRTRYKKTAVQDAGGFESDALKSYYNCAAGLIGGNVYLFAASQGLAAWFHTCDAAVLARELKLRPDQRPVFAQTVGFPAG